MVLNTRLPGITARDVLPIVSLEIARPPDVPTRLTRVETFAGAACLKRFPVIHALRQIWWGLQGATQSGSPPVECAPHPDNPDSWILAPGSFLGPPYRFPSHSRLASRPAGT